MAEEESVKKIQKSINDILGIKSGLVKKRPSVKAKRRELFKTVLTGLAQVNGRSLGLKHDYHIDFIEYDETFFSVIEALLDLQFNRQQKSIIEWYLYDKILPTGETLILTNQKTGEEIPTDTPDDIWDLVQQYEKEDNK